MIIDFNGGGQGGGTTNYNQLTNKPQINDVTLTGNTSLDTLDIPSKSAVTTGSLMAGLAKQIYSPTGQIILDKYLTRTTAGDVSVGSGVAQLLSVKANTYAQYPVYEGFAASVTSGHLTASSTGTTDSAYTTTQYTYSDTGWTPSLDSSITTTGTAFVGDVITTSRGSDATLKLISSSVTDPSVTFELNSGGGSSYDTIWTITRNGNDWYYRSNFETFRYSTPDGAWANLYYSQLPSYGIILSETEGAKLVNGDKFTLGKVYDVNCTVTEASRENHITVAVDKTGFEEEHPESGTYNFTYDGSAWTPSLGDAVSVTGTPYINDVITVQSTVKNYGTLSSSTPTDYWATTTLNAWNKANAISGKTIDTAGTITDAAGSYLCKLEVPVCPSGYTVYSVTSAITRVGIAASATATTVDLSGVTLDSEVSYCMPTNVKGYIYVATTDPNKLCVHPTWSSYEDKTFEEYGFNSIALPTVDASGNTLPPFIAVGETRNEIDFENHKYIKRVESIAATEELIQQYRTTKTWGTDYVFDNDYIYQTISPVVEIALDENLVYTYDENDFGIEGFSGTSLPAISSNYYMENLVDKLRRDVATKDDLADIKIDHIESVSTLPTSGVSAGTVYNYNDQLYKYVSTSGTCGQWFGYTNLNGNNQDRSNIGTSYHYHLLDYFTADYHLATFSYFTSKYCFIVLDKTSETIKIYSGTTNDLSTATLFKTIAHNAASQNVNYGNSFDIEWKGNHIYFRNRSQYEYNRLLNNPAINGDHYELFEGLTCGQMMNGGYGLVHIDGTGNIYMVASDISRKNFHFNRPAGGYAYKYYYGRSDSSYGIPDFYAPTDAGTSGQILKSNGGGAPTWQNVADAIGGITFWSGTQDEYDALGTYSDTICYLIKEDE